MARLGRSQPFKPLISKAVAATLNAYTLTAGAGSYSLTGTAVTLKATRTLAVGAGTYALTGTALGLTATHTLAASAGSYALSGTAAGLTVARMMSAAAGSYALSGTDVTLTSTATTAYTLTASAGSYSLSGTDASLSAMLTTTTPMGGGSGHPVPGPSVYWQGGKRRRRRHETQKLFEAIEATLRELVFGPLPEMVTATTATAVVARRDAIDATLAELTSAARHHQDLLDRVAALRAEIAALEERRREEAIEEEDLLLMSLV